jgi:hypothetical protein
MSKLWKIEYFMGEILRGYLSINGVVDKNKSTHYKFTTDYLLLIAMKLACVKAHR